MLWIAFVKQLRQFLFLRHPPVCVTAAAIILAILLRIIPVDILPVIFCRPHQVRLRIQNRLIVISNEMSIPLNLLGGNGGTACHSQFVLFIRNLIA